MHLIAVLSAGALTAAVREARSLSLTALLTWDVLARDFFSGVVVVVWTPGKSGIQHDY